MDTTIQTCTRCILPATYPGIAFDTEGTCNYCAHYKPFHQQLGKEKLLEVLHSRPNTGAFDCVVPLSGGKDSTYILYYAVKVLGLHPIAVMHNSGFQHPLALANARTACRRLDVPLEEVDSSGALRRSMLKESLLESESVGEFWHPCGNCEAILRTMAVRTARSAGTPFILWGSSALESGEASGYLDYKNLGAVAAGLLPLRLLRRIARKVRSLLRDPHGLSSLMRTLRWHLGYHAVNYSLLSVLERLRLRFPLRYAFRPHAIPPFENSSAVFVHFFDYIEWDSIRMIGTLERELGWRHPEGKETRWDCAIHCFGNYESLRKTSVSVEGVNSCNFIREGKISRADALEKERGIVGSVEGECRDMIAAMGIRRRYRMP